MRFEKKGFLFFLSITFFTLLLNAVENDSGKINVVGSIENNSDYPMIAIYLYNSGDWEESEMDDGEFNNSVAAAELDWGMYNFYMIDVPSGKYDLIILAMEKNKVMDVLKIMRDLEIDQNMTNRIDLVIGSRTEE